jgi:hypothetical protein
MKCGQSQEQPFSSSFILLYWRFGEIEEYEVEVVAFGEQSTETQVLVGELDAIIVLL